MSSYPCFITQLPDAKYGGSDLTHSGQIVEFILFVVSGEMLWVERLVALTLFLYDVQNRRDLQLPGTGVLKCSYASVSLGKLATGEVFWFSSPKIPNLSLGCIQKVMLFNKHPRKAAEKLKEKTWININVV